MEFFSALSVIVAALSFAFGVKAWGREFRGKRRIELVESVLAMFYEAQEAISAIRSPVSFGNEGSSRPRGENETEEERKIKDSSYVPFERYKQHEALFARLRSTKYSFMAMFGAERASSFNDLTMVVHQVLDAARQLGGRFWIEQGRPMSDAQLKVHQDLMETYQARFWEGNKNEDELTLKVQVAVSQIEAIAEAEANATRLWGDRWLGFPNR